MQTSHALFKASTTPSELPSLYEFYRDAKAVICFDIDDTILDRNEDPRFIGGLELWQNIFATLIENNIACYVFTQKTYYDFCCELINDKLFKPIFATKTKRVYTDFAKEDSAYLFQEYDISENETGVALNGKISESFIDPPAISPVMLQEECFKALKLELKYEGNFFSRTTSVSLKAPVPNELIHVCYPPDARVN